MSRTGKIPTADRERGREGEGGRERRGGGGERDRDCLVDLAVVNTAVSPELGPQTYTQLCVSLWLGPATLLLG